MPRRLRTLFPNIPAHIVQRGNNRLPCFFCDNDRRFYLAQLSELAALFECRVHAYVLMTNHVHLLLTPTCANGVSSLMKHLGQRYAQFINRVHQRTGALWEGRFYSTAVEGGRYLFTCYRYIELNPVRAGMVRHPGDFAWSSYRANAEHDTPNILTPHADYLALSDNEGERSRIYRMLFELSIDEQANEELREMTRGGFAFGGKEFKERLSALSGRPMEPQRHRGLTLKPPLGVRPLSPP